MAQEAPAPQEEAPPLVVLQLKSVSASAAAETLNRVMGHMPMQVAADVRSNSLLISAPPSTLASVKDLIEKLESLPESRAGETLVQIFEVRHVEASRLVNILQAMFPPEQRLRRGDPSSPKFAIDEKSNRLLVSATRDDALVIEAVLKRFDVQEPRAGQDVSLRVVWLVTGLPDDHAPLPADLAEVVAELEKHGVSGLGLAAQTIIHVSRKGESPFSAQGTTRLSLGGQQHAQPCRFQIEGHVLPSEDDQLKVSLDIKAGAEGLQEGDRPAEPDQRACALTTTLSLPPGHAVVLGVTPFESKTSVFIVQSLEATASEPGREETKPSQQRSR